MNWALAIFRWNSVGLWSGRSYKYLVSDSTLTCSKFPGSKDTKIVMIVLGSLVIADVLLGFIFASYSPRRVYSGERVF